MSETKRGARKGEFYRPVPLDFAILERLPLKGMIGGIHWRGRRVVDIRNEILEATPELDASMLKSSTIGARLRSMTVEGYVESFASIGSSGSQIWARTDKGTEYMGRRKEVLGE